MSENRLAHLRRFYAALDRLSSRLGGPLLLGAGPGPLSRKARGVYFFFEPGEVRSESGSGLRVVRVGTHALNDGSKSTLWQRLSQHRGTHAGHGNQRSSIFRRIAGDAILRRDDRDLASWHTGASASPDVRGTERWLEIQVSAHLGSLPYLWLVIDDAPGRDSLRGYIERNAIALLSNHGKSHLDRPSAGWLGNSSSRSLVRESGLWNSEHVRDEYDSGFLSQLDGMVDGLKGIRMRTRRKSIKPHAVIPPVGRDHVLSALARIERDGVPKRREATKYALLHSGKRYPPKYVLSLAAEAMTGTPLSPQAYSGGRETNSVLEALGFEIVPGSSPPQPAASDSEKRGPATAEIVRLVVRGAPPQSVSAARAALRAALEAEWGTAGAAEFLITPGGFLTAKFPSKWSGGVGWDSRPADLRLLAAHAEQVLDRVIAPPLGALLRSRVRTATFGIDLACDDSSLHAELVGVYDTKQQRFVRWTGKSYPTGGQARTLVQVRDLESHLLKINGQRVLVLGCQDLNMFSRRTLANASARGPRGRRCREMRALVRSFRPEVVLQHPHSTDSPNIWRTAWSGLMLDAPTAKVWASGICFPRGARGDLASTLSATKSGSRVVDVVVTAQPGHGFRARVMPQ